MPKKPHSNEATKHKRRFKTGAGVSPHPEHEDMPWTMWIPEHPKRTDSKDYVQSRNRMNKIAATAEPFFYGRSPFEDHHGGGLWLKDENGWFMLRNLAGMEWVSQFCADPKKVDTLRQNAKRLYARFPEAAKELKIQALLDTPITNADQIASWTDSVCNASVPLPRQTHTGTLPKNAGMHHYPAPVAEIALFKQDDFPLWVADKKGNQHVVVPVGRRGSGDGRVRVLLAQRKGRPTKELLARVGKVLRADHPIAQAAFAKQNQKIGQRTVEMNDPMFMFVPLNATSRKSARR